MFLFNCFFIPHSPILESFFVKNMFFDVVSVQFDENKSDF